MRESSADTDLGLAEDRTSQGMVGPERAGEDLVDQIVGRVLDHLDLFEDDLLLALDLGGVEGRRGDQVRQHVHGERQVLVEHLDVVAGVFLRGERVEVAADRIDLLRDVLGRCAWPVPLKSMCSTKCAMPSCASGSWRDPRVSQTPMLTDRTCGMRSVTRRSPFGRTSRWMAVSDTVAGRPLRAMPAK